MIGVAETARRKDGKMSKREIGFMVSVFFQFELDAGSVQDIGD